MFIKSPRYNLIFSWHLLIVSFTPREISYSMYLSSKTPAILFGILRLSITSGLSDLRISLGVSILGLGAGVGDVYVYILFRFCVV